MKHIQSHICKFFNAYERGLESQRFGTHPLCSLHFKPQVGVDPTNLINMADAIYAIQVNLANPEITKLNLISEMGNKGKEIMENKTQLQNVVWITSKYRFQHIGIFLFLKKRPGERHLINPSSERVLNEHLFTEMFGKHRFLHE